MKTICTILLGVTLSGMAHASLSKEAIQKLMEDKSVGQAIDIAKMSGGYKGTCYLNFRRDVNETINESNYKVDEALYVGNFVNARGDTTGLAISTENTHGSLNIPQRLSFLLNADKEGFDFITDFVQKGYSGLDNNYGKVNKGKDYSFNYVASKQDKLLIVKAEKVMDCVADGRNLCDPPVMESCFYGYSSQGFYIYDTCLRPNEQIAYKQISESVILSHRTADQLARPTNNMSFSLPEVSNYCVFEKL